MIKIQRALISVYDKTGILELSKHLLKYQVEIISTGGTYKYLQENQIPVKSIEEVTQFPEILDGRVKTLHPVIHAGILANLSNPEHRRTLEEMNISKIDMVVVNLYPFVKSFLKYPNLSTLEEELEIIENIDIGGPTLIRASAKNYFHTVVVCDPSDYVELIKELDMLNGYVSQHTSLRLAAKAFRITSSYDAIISEYFRKKTQEDFPDIITIPLKKVHPLRYGENPHQKAHFYRDLLSIHRDAPNELGFIIHQGKELSFNNLLDLTAAMQCAASLPHYGVAIVKHLNPSGAAYATDEKELVDAFLLARRCDPVSAFGGIIAINGIVQEELAEKITEQFVECVIAREYTKEALKIFEKKANIRIVELPQPEVLLMPQKELRFAMNGYLYQDMDVSYNDRENWRVVTQKQPTEDDWLGLEFAWKVVKFVKSNAIIFTSKNATLAIGAGQMSRVDSAELAVRKAIKNGISLKDSYVASDAFFPFKDGLEIVAKAGARAVIQPGGSIRDQEVIDTANEYGIAMVFTDMRHFRH
ncbi:MAG: bifunctional phosphoribosylaminoimidazolecarboxamide formyltransferase/IMP cyclohydrolase [Leptospiraceae bacterium]|nr:bifunctional phosphoribosylaminoimidazolecarboxamide formyltransferase/IMP cyclohydrolase [Leptospiraceae bacterium]MDW7976781.1 bifunctional phosphoribosylaminoimidazolecarboxamide formyltransferase/IMP cyclohydrolase [Leptospiraceae bacterium]